MGFFPRVQEHLAALRSAFDYIALTSQSGLDGSPAAEWLLDNFHLVEAQLQQIREGVPRRYYAQLPKLSAPPLAEAAARVGISWAYVAHTDSVLDPTLFTAFLEHRHVPAPAAGAAGHLLRRPASTCWSPSSMGRRSRLAQKTSMPRRPPARWWPASANAEGRIDLNAQGLVGAVGCFAAARHARLP